MIQTNAAESKTVYQTPNDECEIPEPSIVVNNWQGVISIEQEGREVILNHGTVKELCKVLTYYKNNPR